MGLYGGRAIAGPGGAVSERLSLCKGLDARGQQLIDRPAPQHLALKDAPEVACRGMKRRLHGRLAFVAGLEFQAGDLAVRNAAGDDPLKVAEVRRYVESEAV